MVSAGAGDTAGTLFHEVRLLGAALAEGTANTNRRSVESATFVAGVERMLRADPEHIVGGDYFDANPDLLGLPAGGAIDLRWGDVLPADRQHRLTRAVTEEPDDDDPPERWAKFLHEATGGDTDLIDFLQRWAGYCLTGHTREHALMFVYGPGGSGKSTFANTLAHVLGEYATTAPMSAFTRSGHDQHPTDLAGLMGARLVTATETDEGRTWAEAKLKLATGGDTITARFLYRDFFTYLPAFKLCIVGNHLPTLRSADSAMRRRFRVAPFDHPPAAPDHHLVEALRDEAPAILEWAICGAVGWYQHGLGTSRSVDLETADYFDSADLIGRWIDERTEQVDPSTVASVKGSALYADFKRWAEAGGHRPGTNVTFGRDLATRGYPNSHRRDGTYWQGLRLHDDDDHHPGPLPYRDR